MIEYGTFLKRLGETKLPPLGHTLFRLVDDYCEAEALYRDDGSGLPLTEVVLDGLGRKIWAGLVEVVEIERLAARKAALAEKRKGPRGVPQSP